MIATLAGSHSMFQGAAADRLKMCEDCRVIAQFQDPDSAFAAGERPRTRVTEDYLDKSSGNGKDTNGE
ncbi:MAG: hypothetical protein R3245_06575 [Kiloniellales bacterium]|nr:hypothetical protein [Kiloniellales bacterium]